MKPDAFLEAARVPATLQPQEFGLWTIQRLAVDGPMQRIVGWPDYTLLHHATAATLHLAGGEIVMEDSRPELCKHLPIWLAARGRVLVTGLGLGCVVRGLLASPAVDQIDVIEIDRRIIKVVGGEFSGDRRVAIHHGDALTIELPGRFDFAWHDLWTDGEVHLQNLHAKLFIKYRQSCVRQGAWAFPRFMSRLMPWRPIGAPRSRSTP